MMARDALSCLVAIVLVPLSCSYAGEVDRNPIETASDIVFESDEASAPRGLKPVTEHTDAEQSGEEGCGEDGLRDIGDSEPDSADIERADEKE